MPDTLLYTLDPYALSMLLRILMRNAIDHAAPCKLQLSWIAPSVLALQDDGPGIAKLKLDKIFQPYFTTKGERRGTGLGLSIVYKIVNDHGATIDIQSTPGEGTRVTMVFRESVSDDV